MTADPLRLLKDPATAAVLRRDLGAAARGVPYDVGAGLARFEASLSQGTGVAAGSTRLGGAGGTIGALLLTGGLAAALGWALLGSEPAPAPARPGGPTLAAAPLPSSPPMVPELPAVVVPELGPPAPQVPELQAPGASASDEREASVARPVKARRPRGARNEVSAVKDGAAGDYLREARSVNAARGQLGHDAGQALALAEAGAAQFKGGTFAQEWEGIAVLALLELGRGDEARARGELFLQRYPSGTYAPRIRQALAEGRDPGHEP